MRKRWWRSPAGWVCILIITVLDISWISFGAEAEASNTGMASWYGSGNPGEGLNKFTASGERFDPTRLTAAAWNYHFGTRLRVVNVKTGVEVIVKVNDRGPAHRLNRIIDLSREAFRKIAPLGLGLVEVRIEVMEEE